MMPSDISYLHLALEYSISVSMHVRHRRHPMDLTV